MPRPDLSRVPKFFERYVNKVDEDDIITALANQTKNMFRFFDSIPIAKHNFAYADSKWTLKEMLQHMVDAERVFTYRALTFARNDKNDLPGFEENEWADASNAASRNWNDLIEEFRAVRKATEYLFASFNEDQLDSTGTVNKNSIYVLALGFITVGHCNHHIGVIKERYL